MKNFFITDKTMPAGRRLLAPEIIANEITAVVSDDFELRNQTMAGLATGLASKNNVLILDCDFTDTQFLSAYGKCLASENVNRISVSSATGRISIKDFNDDLEESINTFGANVVMILNFDSLARLVGQALIYPLRDAMRRLGITIIIATAPRRHKHGQAMTRDCLSATLAPIVANIIPVERKDSDEITEESDVITEECKEITEVGDEIIKLEPQERTEGAVAQVHINDDEKPQGRAKGQVPRARPKPITTAELGRCIIRQAFKGKPRPCKS